MNNSPRSNRSRKSARIRAKWQQHITTQHISGLTQTAYCRGQRFESQIFQPVEEQAGEAGNSRVHRHIRNSKPELIPVILKMELIPATESAKSVPTALPCVAQSNDVVLKARLPNGVVMDVLNKNPLDVHLFCFVARVVIVSKCYFGIATACASGASAWKKAASLTTHMPTLHHMLMEQQYVIDHPQEQLRLALRRQFVPRNEYVNIDQMGLWAMCRRRSKLSKHVVKNMRARTATAKVKRAKDDSAVPIAKSMAFASLIAFLIVSKFADHLPRYRIAVRLKRLGIELSHARMSD